MGVAPEAMTPQCGGPGDARDCVVTRGAVPTLLTSGPGGGQALVRRRKEPAQAHGRWDAVPSSRRSVHSRPLADGKGPKWRLPAPGPLGCSCSC